jgi:fatty acid desaturase
MRKATDPSPSEQNSVDSWLCLASAIWLGFGCKAWLLALAGGCWLGFGLALAWLWLRFN